MIQLFKNREDAGHQLAQRIGQGSLARDTLVLALPRGGVPVAYCLAGDLGLMLDVFLVRKLGVPGHEELAMGALASGGISYLNEALIGQLGISQAQLEAVQRREQFELERREALYRGKSPPLDVQQKPLILVDDGVATGASMLAAIAALRRGHPAHICIAVPVCPADTYAELARVCDDIICLATPEPFIAVGRWYQDFSQVSDQQVRDYLKRAQQYLASLVE